MQRRYITSNRRYPAAQRRTFVALNSYLMRFISPALDSGVSKRHIGNAAQTDRTSVLPKRRCDYDYRNDPRGLRIPH